MTRNQGRGIAWVLMIGSALIALLVDPASVQAYHFGPATIRSLTIIGVLSGIALNGLPTAWKSSADE